MIRTHAAISAKAYSGATACLLLLALAVAAHLAQDSQPTPAGSVSPTPSASPTPVRTPSPTPLPGAQNFHQWGSITVFNGLPSDSVRAIAQTSDGVMWFGTDNGLARFDGRRIQNFSLGNPDADRILSLKTGPNGELFIGTRNGAFVRTGDRFLPVDGAQNVGVTTIDQSGETMIGTDSGRVMRIIKGDGGSFTAKDMLSDPIRSDQGIPLGITSLIDDETDVLAGTAGRGIFRINNGTASEHPTSPRPIFINSLARDTDGQLWLGTEAAKGISGVFTVENGRRALRIPAPTSDVMVLEVNESGTWAGTERYGLFHFVGPKQKKIYTFANSSGGLRSDTIYALFTDREGVIWIGTNRGLSRFDRLGPLQQTVSDSPNGNFIRTLFQTAAGAIYAGSNRGLFIQKDEQWIPAGASATLPIYALAEDRSGKLIIGSSAHVGQAVRDVRSFADLGGATYAAVGGIGLAQVTSGTYHLKYADPSVSTVSSDGDKLWIGTDGNGLFSFDGRDIKLEASPETLKIGMIRRIALAPDKTVWIAGEHGVFRLSADGPEKIIEAEDVRDVLVDGENVWAATTTRGLLHARQNEQFGWLVSSVGFEQGLPSEKAFSILRLDDGLLIATNRGVVKYKPGEVPPKLIATRVLSQHVHDLAEIGAKIELDFPQNSLLLEVAGQSSRTFPEEFQYAFLLKNSRGDLIDSRLSNEAQYAPADLRPGDYTIETTAFNRDLLPSEPLIIRFSVAKAPFPWTATALGVLLAIAIIALVWAVIERRRIVLRGRELTTARLDLAHEAERERRRIARDLHDQTLADLRDLMMKGDKTLPPGTGFRDDIEAISTEIRRICEDLSPSVLENVGFIASLEFLLSHTIENYRFNAEGVEDEQINFSVNVQLQIYRIAQEVLTNIKRHADADLVDMQVSVPAPGSFELVIVNNGKPFTPPEQSLRGGRGIAGIRSRAGLIHAAVEWDETSQGTGRFRLTI